MRVSSHSNGYLLEVTAASYGELPEDTERAGHLALVSQGFAWLLADNFFLQPDVWRAAWDAAAGGDVSVATSLVCRPLSVPDVEHVVRTDRRGSVLAALCRANRLVGTSLDLALAHKSTRSSSAGASALLLQEGISDAHVSELRDYLTAKGLLRVLAFGPAGRLDREWVRDRLMAFEYPFSGRGARNRLLQLACLRDPELAPVLLQAAAASPAAADLLASSVASTAAAAPHLSGMVGQLIRKSPPNSQNFVALAIAGNPLASEEVLKNVLLESYRGSKPHTMASSRLSEGARIPPGIDLSTDSRSGILVDALKRALPGGMYNSPGRPERLMLLARNPQLPAEAREDLTSSIGEAFGRDAEMVIAEELDAVAPGWVRQWLTPRPGRMGTHTAALLSPLGPETARWRLFFSLLDGWSGNIPDLVETVSVM